MACDGGFGECAAFAVSVIGSLSPELQPKRTENAITNARLGMMLLSARHRLSMHCSFSCTAHDGGVIYFLYAWIKIETFPPAPTLRAGASACSTANFAYE